MGVMKQKALLLAASAATLAACSTMPHERPTPPPVPAAFPGSDMGAPGAISEASLTDWWKGFNDPTLDRLVAEGLERSPNVRLALLRLKQARAQNVQTLGAFLPSIDAVGRGSYTRGVQGPPPIGANARDETGIGAYGASVSWEIPLFARVQAAAIGAKANARASLADTRGARVALAGDVASAYVDLRTAQNRLAALKEGAAIALQLADILQTSAGAGIAAPADAADARRQAEVTNAALADAEVAVRVALNQISLLRAHAPGTEPADIAAALDKPGAVPTIALAGAPAAPADLVRLRPDIAQAEAEAIVAAAGVGVARADLLPQLNLTGSILASDNVIGSSLTQPLTQIQATPIITIPLLDWGRRFAAVSVSRARFESALVVYENTVNQGVADATIALTQLDQGDKRLKSARAAESAAEVTAKGFRASYSAGIANLTDRLRSDQQLLDARLLRISAESASSKAAVAVYRAFGGGPPDVTKR
jgi:NodT family efflux transporter outer membrane factor (OMF) lipoprotein